MAQLSKTLSLVTAVILIGVDAPPLDAAPYCFLSVQIAAPDGEALENISAYLESEDGKPIQVAKSDATGHVKFCDVPFGNFQLRLGRHSCGQTVVHGLSLTGMRLHLSIPIRLKVMLDDCGLGNTISTGCLLYIRVTDGRSAVDGASIVRISPKNTPDTPFRYLGETKYTDEFGRAVIITSTSTTQKIRVSKVGFEDVVNQYECKNGLTIEDQVILKPLVAPD
jgi:hypothetical protein